MITFLLIVVGFIIGLSLFLNYYPSFGGKITGDKLQQLKRSKNYSNGKFINSTPTVMDTRVTTSISIMRDFIKGNPKSRPEQPIEVEKLDIEFNQTKARITWFGHSTLMVEMEGKILLLDPMLGKSPSPVPFGNRRFSNTLPVEINDLLMIDGVLISHDHYDHLDYSSIMKLKDKVKKFIVPLGVGSHLERWGIEQERIVEQDWWEQTDFEGLSFICTPARHFSGRGLTNRNSTLWASWVIVGENSKIYFSGDGGYGPHFKEIGEKYGPFDVTLMECGQYDKRWAPIHMVPEETVQAHLDLEGELLIPIHWAGFTLSIHDWTDPIERAIRAAEKQGVKIASPRIGEPVIIGSKDIPQSLWWQ